ncbi:SH3 domain-containing protein [Streptomyces sp. CBMA152]|uniref:SH3 domain-containing protein n=1 Tax=Streptomyces sp. CBMA152 TaxID=1896312 RepID=UPI001CB7290F|nr:SH3 domain-containing protein [Streptomyces sp. CBMA152]
MYVPGMQRIVVAGTVAVLAGAGSLLSMGTASAATPTAATVTAQQVHRAAPAAEPNGKVVANGGLWTHQGSTTASKRLGLLPQGTVVALQCKKAGENVDGNKLWYKLGAGKPGWVAARYVVNLAPVPYCK